MADRMLFISWGQTVRGREERALEVFNESVGFYGRMQADGRVERFEVRLLAPNAALYGYMELEGTAEQLTALREDPQFKRIMADATMIVDDLCICDGYVNEGVADQMAIYTEATSKVPQTTG
jgi:hypothetical protein